MIGINCLHQEQSHLFFAVMKATTIWLGLLSAFVGFLIGVYVATGRETSAVRALLLCPPAVIMAVTPTDPRKADIWKLVAPLNACLYACIALTIRSLLNTPE